MAERKRNKESHFYVTEEERKLIRRKMIESKTKNMRAYLRKMAIDGYIVNTDTTPLKKQYGTVPEYLWSKLPDSAILRHKNGKWYAVIMTVEKSKLGLEGNDLVDIMDVKCDPEMTSMIIQTYGFLPGYHMNKQHWITILLDGSVSEAKTLDFLDMSYDLIDGADRKEEK